MAVPVRYKVVERNVQALASPVGAQGSFVNDIARKAYFLARDVESPVRSGDLRKGIQYARSKPAGYLEVSAVVISTKKYSLFVHEGTTGPITAGGKLMPIPYKRELAGGGEGADGKIFRTSVAGQSANAFLSRSLGKAMRSDARLDIVVDTRL